MLTVSPDNGDCLGWLYPPCGRARVTVPAAGWLTVVAEPQDAGAARPDVQACCVDGDERYGNPVRIPIARPIDIDVEVGQKGPPGTVSASVTLRRHRSGALWPRETPGEPDL